MNEKLPGLVLATAVLLCCISPVVAEVSRLEFKPGMTFDEKRRRFEAAERQCSEVYLKNATKDARSDDVTEVIGSLKREPWVKEVLLAGHSEGSQVATGRPLRYVVVEDGDHGFETSDGRGRLTDVFDDFLNWALDPGRATGVAILR